MLISLLKSKWYTWYYSFLSCGMGVDESTHEIFFFLFSFHKKRDEVNFDWSWVWILSNKKKTNQIFAVSYSFHEKKIHWIYKLNIVFFFRSKFHKILIKIIFNSLVLKILYKQSSLRPLIWSQHINHPSLNLIPNQNQGYTSWRNADQTNNVKPKFYLTFFLKKVST